MPLLKPPTFSSLIIICDTTSSTTSLVTFQTHLAYPNPHPLSLLSRSFSAQLSMSELGGLDRCSSGNQFDGRIGIRISAIFVILAGSLFGEAFQFIQSSLSARAYFPTPIQAQLFLFMPSDTEASVFRNGFSSYSSISDLVLLLPLPLSTYVLKPLVNTEYLSLPSKMLIS